ncbi:ribosomal protein S12 methylthiotransferase accessory factor [Formivibrio citricus]|uniref:Ribosomal protein S12 methylthiotransferase accessory factor n=1 Tax=Formivibrio citricus TaxID=83765 RepID=A0A1I4YJL1_9NEIS|nr:30S ribosomal protein S12 methylthiotransferase accessory factor YcaO [Formivibrio citricus]SFN37790.1 ribosomal protein S12 methylthiotransferase accessory factor [Formivibrio citricus]
MQNEHFIPGKDASLESTIRIMQQKLQELGFEVEEYAWLNPVEAIWSVHLRDRDCPLIYTNGKGATELAARASALGEFFERASSNYFWTHHYLGEARAGGEFVHFPQEKWFPLGDDSTWPEELLTPQLQAFYNPEGGVDADSLVDLNSGNDERGICALPYTRLRDGEKVWFPVNITANLYVSNGMAAGNTPAETRAQALSEIFERHVKFRVIAEGICLPLVPDEVIARYPHIAADIAALRAAGFGIQVRDASLGGRYPVMNVMLLNPRDQGCFASFGAHPRFEIALERALTELLQGRALNQLDGFPSPVFDLEDVDNAPNLESHFVDSTGTLAWRSFGNAPDFDFCDWNFTHTTQEDCDWLVEHIHAEGFDVYLAEYTHLGVYACRILVPGMSEIYPVDDLEWENNSVGNILRPALVDLHELEAEECAEVYDMLEELNLDDQRSIATLIGLAADPGSAWEGLRVGELKALLALAVGDEDSILEGCEWVRNFGQLDAARQSVYHCIESLLGLEKPEAYGATLSQLYGAETLKLAQALLAGEVRFFGLDPLGGNYEGSAMHQRLLAAYDKVQARKAG